MKITITTTEKKLSKSFINQMPKINSKVAEGMYNQQTEFLGFVRGVSKTHAKLAILEYQKQYYTAKVATYEAFSDGVRAYTHCSKGNQVHRFTTEAKCKMWVKAHKHLVGLCKQETYQIYI